MNPIAIIAHRGSSLELPENTLEAFRCAFGKDRADMIEFDVMLSKDQIPVIIHDDSVDRTTDGTGFVSALSVQQLKKLDAGYHFKTRTSNAYPYRGKGIKIPTFEELLQEFHQRTLFVEIKEPSEKSVHLTMGLIEKYRCQDRVIMTSKYQVVFKTILKNYSSVCKAMSHVELRRSYVEFRLKGKTRWVPPPLAASMPLRAYGLSFDHKAWIDCLSREGIKAYFWTIDDPVQAVRLARMPIGGIITNQPAFIRQALLRPDEIGSKDV